MKVRVSIPVALTFLFSLLFQTTKLMASPPPVPPGACLYALDPTAADAFQIAGAQSVHTACGVVSESSSSSAFEMEGSETLYLENHAQVSVVGGADLTGQTYLYDTIGGQDVSAVQTSSPGDPLSSLSPPASGTIVGRSPTYYDMNSKPANSTLSPGIYCGGLTIGNTSGATFTFSPGVYIMAGGGLTFESEAIVSGTGVTFYNTSSTGWGCSSSYSYKPVTISGQVNANLSAPTSGDFDGVLFFGNRTGCSTAGSCVDQINGESTAILNGALYFKSDEIEITGSNASGYTMLVADKIYINGNSNFGENGSPFDDITVSVSPSTASLFAGQTQQFTATVDNTGNTAVTWTISPSSAGSSSSSGLYTAPSSITAQQTVTVTATSQADDTKTGMATITLLPPQAPVITWATPAPITYGTALSAAQLDAAANVPGTFAYSPAAGTVLAAGSQTLSVTFTPTNTAEYTAATASVVLTVNKATPAIIWATPAAVNYGTALSATQLDATTNVPGTFTYSPASGAVLAAGSQTLSVTFTPTNTTDYTTATASVTLAVNKATPVITWATPAAITYGTALSGIQLDATASTPGTFAYSPAAGTVLTAGNQILSVTFTPTDTTDYATATASVTLAVNQATPIITWPTPAPITYGTALSSTQLDATANVPGTFAYTPAAGTVLAAGSQTLSVTFTPTDTTDYTTVTASVTVTVNQATPVITWIAPSAITYGTALSATQLDATTIVAGTFAYSPAVGTLLTAGSQTLSVTFTPTDTTDYTTATASVTLTVNKATPVITWATPAAITYGTALSGTQLDATANVPGAIAYSPAAGTVLTAGSQTLTATLTPSDTTDYTTATASVTLTVNQANPVITWPTPADITYGTALSATQLDATANVPGTFVYSPAAGVISAVGNQNLSVTFTPTDTADYTTATDSVVLTVNPAPQCSTNGYNYVRAIAIDHTQVPNTDQINFPFLFNTTDPLLATTANGGHVANPNGYDIIFTSDPAGQNPLNYEMEEYNPVTGQAIAWVSIPDLSHTTDTVIYLFYGNSAITNSQQNPAGVWTSNYQAVYHLANVASGTAADSTAHARNGVSHGVAADNGQIDGAGSFNGSSSNVQLSQLNISNVISVSAWFQTTADGVIFANANTTLGNSATSYNPVLYVGTDSLLRGGLYNGAGLPVNLLSSQAAVNDGHWHLAYYTSDGTTQRLYLDGNLQASASAGSNTTYYYYIGTGYTSNWSQTNGNWFYFGGAIDETRISNTALSADWIATEYTNQSSPGTFYSLSSESEAVAPSAVTLYAQQSQQFTVTALASCPASVVWSVSPSGVGTLTQNGPSSGLYTAPSSIATQQTVTITATSQTDGSTIGTSVVTLDPQVSVSVTPGSPTLYAPHETVQFTATVSNAGSNAVTWSISPNTGSISQSGLYTAPSFSEPQTVTITATSVQDPTQSGSATLTLMPVIVSPSSASVYSGFTQQFAANIPVVWSIVPGGIGTVSQTGLYTAPSNTTTSGYRPDVVATAQADPNGSFTVPIQVGSPIVQPVTPAAVSLYGGQSQTFNVCLATSGSSSGCQSSGQTVANWYISPASAGAISSSGVYTAPALIPTQQTVTVTAADIANPVITSTGTITLLPPVISVTPQSMTLYAEQTQQFNSVVTDSSNTAVNWSISPAGAGSISSSGLYSAPPYIASQQTVTATATLQTIPSISTSAFITLSPAECPAKAYGYVRAIVIDHNQVPNTDEANFPLLFSSTDPAFATTANGGHIANENAFDVIFTSDSAGLKPLNYELEEYNPVTGQIIAWVGIPNLSHSSDTVIYMFYGNPNITASQQNPTGVWGENYLGVWHLPNGTTLSANDSTINANNGILEAGVSATPGEIDGAAIFNGSSGYITTSNMMIGPTAYSLSLWFNTTTTKGGKLIGFGSSQTGSSGSYDRQIYMTNSGQIVFGNFNGSTVSVISPRSYNDGHWHSAVGTLSGTGQFLYIDGTLVGSNTNTTAQSYSGYWRLGYDNLGSWPSTPNSYFFGGSLDEARVSAVPESADWVTAENANQSSPGTFYSLSPENQAIAPSSVTLYAQQSQQFTLLETDSCNAGDAVWSMAAGSQGTLSPNGLYTAPATIDTQQTVTVTATPLGANAAPLNATITLMPPVSVSVLPDMVSLPASGTQQFTAIVSNASNTAVTWSLNPVGVGTLSTTGLYTAPATISGQQTVFIIATSVADPSQSASATVTLGLASPPPPILAIAVNPASADVYAGQTQQFTATVTNTSNTAVSWSMSPAGVGSIDDTGLYTAPASITTEQTVTITATSQADSALTASASVTLVPSCVSNGYNYVRQIVVNASQVSNSDQVNFPFLFNTTDPLLATTANGGHVANPNGYDIIFTSDPAGQNPLNYEIEEYNPASGQVIAWVQIPDLSHTSNTVIYLFYGNPSVTTSQQNPSGVWDSNFVGVWHLPNGTVLSGNDSTSNGNNLTNNGATAISGIIDGGAAFNGSSYLSVETGMTISAPFTIEEWAFPTSAASTVGLFGSRSPSDDSFDAKLDGSGVHGDIGNGSSWLTTSASGGFSETLNTWHHIAYVVGTSNYTIYADGQQVGSGSLNGTAVLSSSSHVLNLGWTGYDSEYFSGNLDEARVSNITRSADWIAAEYNNQISPSTFYTVSAEGTQGIVPASVTLYANQSQQFADPGLCSVNWSLSAGASGTLTLGGLYTAPSSITSPQTLTVVATSQANPSESVSATVTLLPPVSVAVSPSSVTLNENQTQQFTAMVTDSSNPAVIWSISPAGLGSIDQTGAYGAPSSIITQQTVVVTATSVTDPTKSASAMVTLSPSVCASTGYGYQRAIVIDHTKVANTDQINFPFLFNSTDPGLATLDNGGHVANPNGYDIIFSAAPNGQTRLDFEIEQYNPVTGQLVAWIRIPTLSHSSDTVIYIFYGNPAITTSQANSKGVWDSNYQAVYHLGTVPSTEVAADSTNYANDASFANLTAMPGEIDGSAGLDGATSYLEIPATAFPNYPSGVYSDIGVNSGLNAGFDATYSIWFKTSSWGGLLDQTASQTCTLAFFGCILYAPEEPGDTPQGSWNTLLDVNFDGQLEGREVGPSTQVYNDNKWHYATITYGNGVNNLYADGQLIATGQGGATGFSNAYAYFAGAEDVETDTSVDAQPWKYLPGQIDEINVSNITRSSDWIQTQFNDESSPATFYTFYPQNAVQVAPPSISLYASQNEQFVVPSTCDVTITWSLPTGSPGSLTSAGLYTAPSMISSQETVTISAVSQSNGASYGSAQVTLLPAPQPLTLVASSPSPYQAGSSQSFTATLLDPQGNPLIGVTVNFAVAGPNETVGSATTSASGTASFTYTGLNSGTDTVQATASVDGALLTSNSVTAAWLTPPPVQALPLTLLPQPSPGRGALMGAFTDNKGDLIEPIVVGTSARTFITPAGATRLQLGINDTYYADNGGAGFVVAINGVNVTVPPTAMPWNWKTGGINNNYQYGINDGTSPVIAAASLTAGEPVTIAYQSGSVSSNYPINPLVNANGEPNFITGTQLFNGAYFPTLYTTGSAYPQNLPINVFAVLTNASGVPIPNTQVTLGVSGANPGQYQATTDATGTASFLYVGENAGNDSLNAQAVVNGEGTLTSNQTTLDWTNYPTPPPVGSLTLYEIDTIVERQDFSAYAKDASGNALPNVNMGYYITGVDNIQTSVITNNIGQGYYRYFHTVSGNYSVVAVDSVDRNVIVTPAYTGDWNAPSGTPVASGGSISVGISADSYDTIPNALQLNGTVTDSAGLTTTDTWNEISGPGTVTFADPSNPVTTATFSEVGTYVLQLFATDSVNSGWVQISVTVLAPSVASQSQGWIGSPVYGSTVTGVVPITLAPGITLASGTLSYMPTNNTSSVTIINSNVTGSGQIGTLDTTMLANGSYWIQMQGTNTGGNAQYSLVLVTVTGNYKPGRVTSTVADLVVPATGLSIQIQRSYDSLNASTIGDFGFGWNLGINTNLTVDPSGNVTFTIGGQRKTFDLTPQMPPCTVVGCLFPYYFVGFTPEPGAFGTLTDSGEGCPLDIVVPYGSLWECYGGSGQYNPPGYIYTDPTGTAYTISAGGQLQSVADKSGNGLTITPNGITSTTGLNVPFVRDNLGRITQITDPQGNQYLYQYDTNGNLASVFYPNTQQPSTYNYDQSHFYLSGTDFRNNPLPVSTYYAAHEMDASGNYSVAGKLQSVTDGLGETTSYTYNLATNTTVVTYPPDANGNIGTATMVYDANGDVLSSTDPLGHTTTNTYDAKFNLLSTTDPLNHTTSYTYDANGNQTSATYPATATSTNTTSTTNYNQFSEPTSITDEDGNTRTLNYDANYNPASVTDSVGTLMSTQVNTNGTLAAGTVGFDITQNPARASQFTYDANGNLASQTDALGRTTSYTYNALGQKITMTEPVPAGSTAAAATTTYTYDPLGNLTQTQAPLGRTTSSTYDANSNKLTDTDARGNTTNYIYDALNRLIETDYPDGTKTTKTYDFHNNVITETNQNGNVTLHQYDLAGRQISVTQAYGTANATTTQYAYDNAGRMTSQTDALGHSTTYTYDAAGNLLATSGVAGNFSYAYDNARNKIAMTDGNGNITRSAYDARNRLTVTTYPDQTTKINTYDGPGNLISVTDQAGNQVQYNYDAANQLISVVEVNSPNSPANTTVYGYDANGNPIALEDANQHTTASAFDLLSELTSKVLPDGALTETRTYDNNGNLATVTHFNGVTTTYTYDQLNRLLSRATPGETTVSFTYTATGKRQTMTDQSGATSYSYDSMDRLTTKATPEGTLSYTYDLAGNLASMTSNHTHGVSATYSYDDLNRLSTVTDANLAGMNITAYSYDNASNVGSVTYPNGIAMQFTYDLLNRVSSASSQVSGYQYQRGPTGNLTSATEQTGRTENWNFDGIYRLTSETISVAPSGHNGNVSYSLDPVGNRLSDTSTLEGISSGSWGYNSDDEVSSESYDQNGNVKSTGGKTFAYDSENHLISMNGGAVSIVYDGDGNRVAKTAKGVTTYYLVDGLNPTGYSQVVEELQGGAVTRQYTYGLQRISENQPINSTWTVSFYGYDGGGNVRNLTNSASTVTDTYEYDAFGNVFTVGGTTPNNYLYRGEQYDPDLGLYYLRARYYNPLTGRFMSRDSEDAKLMDPATLHRYLYAKGDPINAFDPTGRDWLEYKLLLKEVAPEAAAALTIAAKIICGELAVVAFVIDGLHYFNPSSPGLPWPVKAPCALYGIGTAAYAAWLALIAEL
ncbi:MAG: DUF2341 domain-containing protein [Terracidiphilus sp.]|jgi:RHS repeat-associated protein